MLQPNIVTIITSVEPGREFELRDHIRCHADIGPAGEDRQLAFSKLPNLHFFSFVVVPEDAALDLRACLVLEATIDGDWRDFIEDLVSSSPEIVDGIYRHCVGYPICGTDVPRLVTEYLSAHFVWAQTYYCGFPGRSVAQIVGENSLRQKISDYINGRLRKIKTLPPTYSGIQKLIRRDVVRMDPSMRWAELPYREPAEVRHGETLLRLGGLAVVAISALILAALTYETLDWSPQQHFDAIRSNFVDQRASGPRQSDFDDAPLKPSFMVQSLSVSSTVFLILACIWLGLRIAELFADRKANPATRNFADGSLALLVRIFRNSVLWIMLLSGVITIAHVCADAIDLGGFLGKLPETGSTFRSRDFLISLGVLLAVLLPLFLVLQYFKTSLELKVQLRDLEDGKEAVRIFLYDSVWMLRAVTVLAMILIVARHFPSDFRRDFGDALELFAIWCLVGACFVVAAALLGWLIYTLLFCAIRIQERREVNSFADASSLTPRSRAVSAVYAREEHGVNERQNHLASLTVVKPGLFRQMILRTVLRSVNFLARYRFNKGELGQIPTIFSARWVLIDRGKRLLFLTHYGGAWESYLNEFIDLAAVTGVNAIWTNTRLPQLRAEDKPVGFPRSRFLLWDGARFQRQFKMYVRCSQLETLAWYGAYRNLSVTNINHNSKIRDELFKSLSSAELDSFVQRL